MSACLRLILGARDVARNLIEDATQFLNGIRQRTALAAALSSPFCPVPAATQPSRATITGVGKSGATGSLKTAGGDGLTRRAISVSKGFPWIRFARPIDLCNPVKTRNLC